MKKIIAVALCIVMALSLAACSGNAGSDKKKTVTLDNIKIGFVHIGDPSDMGYTYNHNRGTEKMKEDLGLKDDQIINKFNVPETSECATALRELAEDGCDIIFATSFGFETYVEEVAAEYPNIQFCHATGYMAASSELKNDHNYFGAIYQARYLTGIAAGLKAAEIGNNVLGYVTAKPFAECISGFTAFYLGAKSVNPDVTMNVMYTNEWNDPTKEQQVAEALITQYGCGVIGQHCDSTAPATTAEANGAFHVGYNSDMREAAPNASLTSAIWDWSVYLEYAVNCVVKGDTIPDDWSGGLKEGAVDISPLNDAIVAPGTAEAIEAARTKIESGSWDVFQGPLYTADGAPATITDSNGNVTYTFDTDAIFKEPASAPSFNCIIDGITVVE